MSTRQNKKQRKGRNANNRERTVTTLTADPSTQYLVPKPSEEPARSHAPSSSVASGSIAGQILNMSMGPQPYPISGNFGFGYPIPFAPIQQTNLQQQQQQQQQPYYPTSQQMPQQASNLPPGKSDLEILQNLKKMIKDGQHPFYRAIPSPTALANLYKGPQIIQAQQEAKEQRSTIISTVGPSSDRRQLRSHTTDRKNMDARNGAAVNRPQNVPPSVANLNLGALQISKESPGPPSASLRSAVTPASDSQAVAMDVDQHVHGKPGSVHDGQSQTALRDATATERGAAPLSDSPDLALERTHPPHAVDSAPRNPPGSVYGVDHKMISTTITSHDGHDQKAFSAGREWYPNDHDRRVVYERPAQDVCPSESVQPVPLADVPGFSSSVSQPPIVNSVPVDRKPDVSAPVPAEASQPPIHAPEIIPSRDSSTGLPILDSHPQPISQVEHRAPLPQYTDQPSSEVEDVQSSRASSVRPADDIATLSSVPPRSSVESLPPATDSSSLPPSSLQEPVNPDPAATQPVKPAVEAAGGAAIVEQRPVPQQPERFGKKNKFQKGQHFQGPGKFGRPGPPLDGPPPGSAYGPRVVRPRTPSPDGRRAREYRGPPPPSRDRVPFRPEYDPRRPDLIDPDIPPPARYEGRPYNEFPLNERRLSAYPASPPPMAGGRGPPPVDPPPGRSVEYYMYPPSREDWDMQDDDYYKARERGWDRPPPLSADRERFERDPYGPRPGSWDPRQDRDYIPRDVYAPGPPPPPMPIDDRYPPGPPMSRDGDRGHLPPPGYSAVPYGRVRPRSPSPMGRAGLDDPRPPMKRAREEFPPDYYQGGRPPVRRPLGPDYPPPRSGGQVLGGEWPVPIPAGPGGGGMPPRSRREYRPVGREPPMEYGAPPYERAPQGPPGRMPYGADGHGPLNDRGGYPPRPPQ